MTNSRTISITNNNGKLEITPTTISGKRAEEYIKDIKIKKNTTMINEIIRKLKLHTGGNKE